MSMNTTQLKTLPLKADKILSTIKDSSTVGCKGESENVRHNSVSFEASEYCHLLLDNMQDMDIIGFEHETRSLIEVLARKDRANVLIVGESGVGKTSLIANIVMLVRNKKIPASLASMHPFELDVISLSQGVSYKGEIEDRFKDVVKKVLNHQQPILIIDNFHRIEDKQSILNGILPIIKKLLSENQIQFICTSTIDGYTKDIEHDKELTSYFEKITVEEPTESVAVEILKSKCAKYEDFHKISISEDVPVEIVRLAKRYIPERNLPSSALDLLDRSMASIKIENELADISDKDVSVNKTDKLEKATIRDVVSKMTGIPMGNIQSEEREKLSNAEAALHKRVVGQNHAVKSVCIKKVRT